MNGAERMIKAAVEHGLEVCFANPGTTEMPFVNALDSAGGMAAVLGLHENVCTGAADGYARMTGKPALTLLHLGPGFANGLANLHNARRAYSPVVNLIGEHAAWHLAADPPLASEIERLTGWAGRWTRRTAAADSVVRDMTEAVAAARARRGGIASLIVPHDIQLADAASAPTVPLRIEGYPGVAADQVEAAARLLATARRPALLLGGNALFGAGLEAAGQRRVGNRRRADRRGRLRSPGRRSRSAKGSPTALLPRAGRSIARRLRRRGRCRHQAAGLVLRLP